MSFTFKKAKKLQRKLRMALMGPSGSGKTYTALTFATELAPHGGKIALIDTERGSAALYSDKFNFDACDLDTFDPQNYIDAIAAAAQAGYDVLIIDSLSHAWSGEGGVLDQVSRRGGDFSQWGKVGTPLQNKLIKAILDAPMHVIVTMRVKTEYAVEQDDKGKMKPKRIGLGAVQRDGVEYEFDIIGTIDIQNNLTIEKTRMDSIVGETITKPGREFARRIMAWLSDGAAPPTDEEMHAQLDAEIATARDALPRTDAQLNEYVQKKFKTKGTWQELPLTDKRELLDFLNKKLSEDLFATQGAKS